MGIFKEYLLTSTIHGLHFLADQRYHWSERLFWLICVIASWVGSLFLMVTALQQYQNQKISFSVDTSYLNWHTNFPSIFLCEGENEASRQILTETYGEQCLVAAINFAFFDGTADVKTLDESCHFGKYSEVEKTGKHLCTNLMNYCTYNDQVFYCCDEFLKVSTYYGTCFGFNTLTTNKYPSRESLPFKISRHNHPAYGNLSIELKHPHFRILAAAHNSAISYKTIKLYDELRDKSVNKFMNSYIRNYYLSVKETFTEEESRILDVQHRGCRFQDENNLNRTDLYSMSACENECMASIQKIACGCIVHTFPNIDSEDECDLEGLLCLQKNDFQKRLKAFVLNCKCVSSCADTEVNLIGSTTTVIPKEKEEIFFKSPTSEFAFNVIVQSPTIRYTRQVVKTPLSLLVSVGGIVSLFIGASILSIVEILYYFLFRPFGNYYLSKKQQVEVKNDKKDYVEKIKVKEKESRKHISNACSNVKNVKSWQYLN